MIDLVPSLSKILCTRCTKCSKTKFYILSDIDKFYSAASFELRFQLRSMRRDTQTDDVIKFDLRYISIKIASLEIAVLGNLLIHLVNSLMYSQGR